MSNKTKELVQEESTQVPKEVRRPSQTVLVEKALDGKGRIGTRKITGSAFSASVAVSDAFFEDEGDWEERSLIKSAVLVLKTLEMADETKETVVTYADLTKFLSNSTACADALKKYKAVVDADAKKKKPDVARADLIIAESIISLLKDEYFVKDSMMFDCMSGMRARLRCII